MFSLEHLDGATGREARACFDEIAGHLNAQHGRLVDAAIWVLSNPIDWQGEGLTRPEHFLAWRFALSPTTARHAVLLAERHDELPETIQALREGLISFDQAVTIARHAPAWADRQALNLGARLTVSQIRRTMSTYPWPEPPNCTTGESIDESSDANPDPADDEHPTNVAADAVDAAVDTEPPPPHDPTPVDRVHYGRTANGRWYLHADLALDAGLVIANALHEARDRLVNGGDPEATNADALLDIATRSLGAVSSYDRRQRFRTNIHLDATRTRTRGSGQVGLGAESGCCGLTGTDDRGFALPDAITRHITCDGLLTPVFVDNGIPVSVGRSQHIVPDRTRRLILHRDGGCTVPGCEHHHHLEVHHIVHWADGGPTDTWNLLALCPRHHRLHHQGHLKITGNADDGTVTFVNEHGKRLRPSGARPEPPGRPPPPPAGRYRAPYNERLDLDYVSFPHPSTLTHEIRRRVVP